MTQPRQVLAGATSLITRRTLRRHHLFRPDPAIRQLYLYALAVSAREFEVLVHALTLMSTHEHLVVTDTRGCLPDFLRQLHRLVALGTKSLRRWEGPVWDHRRTSVVRLVTERATIEKLAYVIANPVEAGLVEKAREWPGIIFLPQELGRRRIVVRRPEGFFDPDNPKWPETAEMKLSLPSALQASYDPNEVRESVASEVERLEGEARAILRKERRRPAGPIKIQRFSPFDRATTQEPTRRLNPTFAVGSRQRGAFLDAVRDVREFRRAYRQAFEQWRAGLRSVVFPEGTWLMKQLHGAAT